jgi:YHS domain-containing protein
MRTLIVIIGWMLVTGIQVLGQSEDARKRNFNVKKNVAIEGYDPVSYFNHKPEEGQSDLPFTHKGVTYWFLNETNRNKFKSAPEKFEPAYGGWCAYAMGETGEKVKVDPETYKILDGKLFLFYNFWGNNTLTDWNKNEKQLRARGDENWKKFIP